MSIRLKLTIIFLAVALIPTILVGTLSFKNYKHSLQEEQTRNLQYLAAYKSHEIEVYFKVLKTNIQMAQGFYNIKKNLPVLSRLANDPNNSEFLAAKKMLDLQFSHVQSILAVNDIMLLDPRGNIIYSSNPSHTQREFLKPLPPSQQDAFEQGKTSIYLSDIFIDKEKKIEMLLCAPAHDLNDVFAGVIVLELNMSPVYELIQDTIGLGKTGETLIGRKVGDQVQFVNPLRHDPEAILNRKVALGEVAGFPIQQAVQGKTGSGITIDYRGKEVVATWRYIPSLNWGMVAKIDTDEAFADVKNLQKLITIVLILISFLVSIMAFAIARSIAEPVKKLALGAQIIGSGNLDYKVGTNLKDEIGQLSRTFDKMTSDLKTTIASRDELNKEIEEREHAEAELKQSESRYRSIVATALDAFWQVDFQGHFLDVNAAACRMLGYSRDELLKMRIADIEVIENPEDVKRHLDKIISTGWDRFESKHRHKDGSIINVEISTSFVKDTGQVFVFASDITERKKAEEAMRESELFYRQTIESIPGMVFTTRPDGYCDYQSQQWVDYSGIPMSEHLGDGWNKLLHPDDRPRAFEAWRAAVEGRAPYNLEYRVRRYDGKYEWFKVIGKPIRDVSGQIVRWFGVAANINELKETEEQIKRSTQRFELLSETASQLLHSDNPQEIVSSLCRKVMEHLDCQTFFNFLVDDKISKLHLNACEGIPEETAKNIEWLDFGVAVCGCVARDGKRIIAEHVQTTPDERTELIKSFGIKAYACHPLLGTNGKLIGTLSFGTRKRETFNDEDLSMMKAVSDQVATAMERINYQKWLQKAKDELEIRVAERTAQLSQQASLIDLAHDAIFVRDMEGKVTFWSKGSFETYGWAKEESLGQVSHKLLKTKFPEPLEKIELSVIEKGRWDGELIHTGKDGKQIFVTSRWALQKDKDGKVTGILEINRDVTARREAEQVIKAERKRFEDVLEMMPAYAVLLTPDYHVAFANRTFREWFGDDNGRKCYEFLFNRNTPCENCQTYKVLETNQPQKWEWTGPDGGIYDIYDYPFKDTDGSPLIMEIGVDITAHKHAQKAFQTSEERYRSLTVATTQVVWTTAANGEVVGDMPSWREFTGQTIEEIQGRGWINSLHPDDREGTAKVWTNSVENKSLYNTEYRLKRHDGQYRYVAVRGVPVLNPDNSIREWIGTCTDITDHKNADTKQDITTSLLELFAKKTLRKAYLNDTVKVIRNWSNCEFIGVRVKDKEGNIPYEATVGFDESFLSQESNLCMHRDKDCICSRAILQQGAAHEQHLLTPAGSFFCNNSQNFIGELSKEQQNMYRGLCVKRGYQSLAVIPIRYRDEILGAIHLSDFKKDMVPLEKIEFIESTIAPLIGEAVQRFNSEEELENYRLHLEELVENRTEELENEVTHRKEIAEDLSRSNKDLEQFAYVASHDLQEPLRAVAGFVELLRMQLGKSLDGKKIEYMDFAIDGVKRMQALINGLLEYSRIGTRGKAPEIIDARTAVDKAVANLQISIKESGAKIIIEQLPKIRVDPTQLTQLFQNLINNAIKFRNERTPEIKINAQKQDNYWKFSIADNGIGIDSQYGERIFLIFQRLHTRVKYPGTGIGLSICKKIVERHGGKIWVESKAGHGSIFYFTMPDLGEVCNEFE